MSYASWAEYLSVEQLRVVEIHGIGQVPDLRLPKAFIDSS
jgi:hypothetical protein